MKMKIENMNYPLFENISVLELENGSIDLHNDFDFRELILENENQEMILSFSDTNSPQNRVLLIFEKVQISKISIKQFNIPDKIILDSMYRGKAEINGVIIEKNEESESYFYLDFLEDIQLEFWTSNLRIELIVSNNII